MRTKHKDIIDILMNEYANWMRSTELQDALSEELTLPARYNLLERMLNEASSFGLQRLTREITRMQRQLKGLSLKLLKVALRKRHYEAVKDLVAIGADLLQDRSGLTPLARAAFDCEEDVMSMLLNAGCQVDARNSAGDTALMYAIFSGCEGGVRMLIDAGADVNARGTKDGWPVIVTAACMNCSCWPSVMSMLLSAGADINASTPEGYTALRQAVHKGRPAMVKFLISHGANINTVDARGQSPLEHALAKEYIGIAHILLSHGALPPVS